MVQTSNGTIGAEAHAVEGCLVELVKDLGELPGCDPAERADNLTWRAARCTALAALIEPPAGQWARDTAAGLIGGEAAGELRAIRGRIASGDWPVDVVDRASALQTIMCAVVDLVGVAAELTTGVGHCGLNATATIVDGAPFGPGARAPVGEGDVDGNGDVWIGPAELFLVPAESRGEV